MRVVFDIDGTLSDLTHRLHFIPKGEPKDWDSFFGACLEDQPHRSIVELARSLANTGLHDLQFWTGRPERVRKITALWLRERGLMESGRHLIRMRRDGDHRPDDVVKLEYLSNAWYPDLIFEDRSRVVEAFRAKGITVVQVAPGDF